MTPVYINDRGLIPVYDGDEEVYEALHVLARIEGEVAEGEVMDQVTEDIEMAAAPEDKPEEEAKKKARQEREKEFKEHKKKHPFVKDYRYGRCQVSNGTRCIRNLQSPERRKYARSEPKGKTCMFCEDDTSKWSDVPKEVWSSPKWKKADNAEKSKILDAYVKRNNPYNSEAFKPSYY